MDLESPHIVILQDLRLQTFDGIRFASYRTASKLRYIQKSTNRELANKTYFFCVFFFLSLSPLAHIRWALSHSNTVLYLTHLINICLLFLVHLVDIWNVIEAFRENGLNTMEPQSDVSVARLETLVSSLYHNLNKRLTTVQQVPVDSKASLLLNWLIAAYSHDNSGKMRVFSIKVALATMCAGKLVDKLRCK